MVKDKFEYNIYVVSFRNIVEEYSTAIISAKSEDEAESMLEKEIVKEKDADYMKGKINSTVKDTGFKASKKGIIFGMGMYFHSFSKL